MSDPNESEVSPTPSDKAAGGGRRPSSCSSFRDHWLSAVDRLESLQQHLEGIAEKLIEVREELVDQGNDFRLVPLSYQDSGVVLAVCEKIGVDLIPLTPWKGSLFLQAEQLSQLNEAMAEYQDGPHPPKQSASSDEMWERETIKAMLAEQALAEVREIIEKGGTAQDVMNFLDTPTA